jgi:hypothetical protein
MDHPRYHESKLTINLQSVRSTSHSVGLNVRNMVMAR